MRLRRPFAWFNQFVDLEMAGQSTKGTSGLLSCDDTKGARCGLPFLARCAYTLLLPKDGLTSGGRPCGYLREG
jgi:hypothetical protein